MWVIASHDGTIYLGEKHERKVWWGLKIADYIYKFEKDVDVKDYVDLGREENETDMYRYTLNDEKKQLVYFKEDEEENLKKYLQVHYKGEITDAFVKYTEMYVNYHKGHIVPASNDALLVKRWDYKLQKSSPSSETWCLRYTKFKAYFPTPFEDGDNTRVECVVYHTRTFDELCKAYLKYNPRLPTKDTSGIENSLNKLLNQHKKIRVLFGAPTFASGNRGTIFKMGTYGINREVVVKTVVRRNVPKYNSVLENYRSITYHENIAHLYGHDEDSGHYRLAIEKCKCSLEAHMARHKYEEMSEESIKIMRGIVTAVAHMHRQGIVHGNLNPANILLDDDNRAKLCGFGHSIQADSRTNSMCTEMLTVGRTLLTYMSNKKDSLPHKYPDEPDGKLPKVIENDAARVTWFTHDVKNINTTNDFNCEGFDLLTKLFNSNPLERPTAEEVLKHPRLMTARDRLTFFRRVSDFDKDGVKANIIQPSSKNILHPYIHKVRDIRNEYSHILEYMGDEVILEEKHRKQEKGLLMQVYNDVRKCKEFPWYKEYY